VAVLERNSDQALFTPGTLLDSTEDRTQPTGKNNDRHRLRFHAAETWTLLLVTDAQKLNYG